MSQLTEFGRARPGSVNALMPWLAIGGVAATLLVATVWELTAERRQIAQSTADVSLASIVGPPCPRVSAASFQKQVTAEGRGVRYVDEFNGDTFGRSFGDGDCSVATAKGSLGLGSYNVCEFTGPSVLYVKTDRGVFYFLPGLGAKATVMTEGGLARCVMAAPKFS